MVILNNPLLELGMKNHPERMHKEIIYRINDLLNSTWKRKHSLNNLVFITKKEYGDVYKFVIHLNCKADYMYHILLRSDEKWNSSVSSVEVIKKIDDNSDIIKVTADLSKDVFHIVQKKGESLEFINYRIWQSFNNAYLIAAKSLNNDQHEKNKIIAWIVHPSSDTTCTLEWMVCLDLSLESCITPITYIFFKKYISDLKKFIKNNNIN